MGHPVIEREQTARAEAERPPSSPELDMARQHMERDSPFGLVFRNTRVRLERGQDDSEVVVLD